MDGVLLGGQTAWLAAAAVRPRRRAAAARRAGGRVCRSARALAAGRAIRAAAIAGRRWLHPFGVARLVAIQWWALARRLARPARRVETPYGQRGKRPLSASRRQRRAAVEPIGGALRFEGSGFAESAEGFRQPACCRRARPGWRIELVVRGICCLRPGGARPVGQYQGEVDRRPVPRDSRIWCFGNGEALPTEGPRLHQLGRLDAAQFDRRVEYMLPLENRPSMPRSSIRSWSPI